MWSDFVRSAVQVSWSVAEATLLSYWTERERLQLRASRRSATRKIIRLKSFFLEASCVRSFRWSGADRTVQTEQKACFFFFLFLFLLSPLIWNPFKFCQWLQSHDEPGSASVRARCLRVYWKWKIMICHMRMYEKGLQKSLGDERPPLAPSVRYERKGFLWQAVRMDYPIEMSVQFYNSMSVWMSKVPHDFFTGKCFIMYYWPNKHITPSFR